MKCIFCLSETSREPVEHIVPEGLIGHRPVEVRSCPIISALRQYLVLDNGEVCRRCNHKLGHLDEYLQDQFGFLRTYWNPVGTKSGKPVTAQRPGMYAKHGPSGPILHINAECHPVTTGSGVTIQPAGTHELAIQEARALIAGPIASLEFGQPIRMNKRFMRALHKIGFELLCLHNGAEFVIDSNYDSLREYILNGRGNRTMLFEQSGQTDSWERLRFNLRHDPAWPGWLAIIRIATHFYIDLSPDNHFFANVDLNILSTEDLILWSDKDGGHKVT